MPLTLSRGKTITVLSSGSCSVNELPSLNYPHPWTSKASHGAHINKGERTLWFFA